MRERLPFILRWVFPFGVVLVATAMTLMVIFLRSPPPPPEVPWLERRDEHLVVHPAGRSYLILGSVHDGRVAVHVPSAGTISAEVVDGSGIPIAGLPRAPLYGFFSLRPLSVATVVSSLGRGLTAVPGATLYVFRW